MSEHSDPRDRPRCSRQRYRQFVEDYRRRRLDALNEDQRRLTAPEDRGPTGDGVERRVRRDLATSDA